MFFLEKFVSICVTACARDPQKLALELFFFETPKKKSAKKKKRDPKKKRFFVLSKISIRRPPKSLVEHSVGHASATQRDVTFFGARSGPCWPENVRLANAKDNQFPNKHGGSNGNDDADLTALGRSEKNIFSSTLFF